MHENMDMNGQVHITLTDQQGQVVYARTHKNRIVKTGRQLVAQLFGGVSAGAPPSKVSHMGVGTDGTTASDDQTSLIAARGNRNPIAPPTYSEIVDASSGSPVKRIKVSLQTVFDYGEANGDAPLREAAIFTAAQDGVMYNRVVFDPVSKTSTFKLTLIWDITF